MKKQNTRVAFRVLTDRGPRLNRSPYTLQEKGRCCQQKLSLTQNMKYKIIRWIALGTLILAIAVCAVLLWNTRTAGQEKTAEASATATTKCVEVAPHEYDCTDYSDTAFAAKVMAWKNDQIKEAVDRNGVTVSARVTKYSPADSCHYPDGKGGCLNAQGTTVQEGEAACPHWLDFGTKISVGGETYTCTDRTADWVQSKWIRTPTFDLFVNDCSKGCGRTFADVKVVAR